MLVAVRESIDDLRSGIVFEDSLLHRELHNCIRRGDHDGATAIHALYKSVSRIDTTLNSDWTLALMMMMIGGVKELGVTSNYRYRLPIKSLRTKRFNRSR